jgi:hypothetical protein
VLGELEEIKLQIIGHHIAISDLKKNFNELQKIEIKQGIEKAEADLKDLLIKRDKMETYSQKILQYLQSEKLIYICKYSVNKNKNEDEALLCKIDNLDIDKAELFLKKLSLKVFLAAPATQVFIFLSKESRKSLFINSSPDKNKSDENNKYYSELQTAKSKLRGFFAYDF